MPMQGSGQGRSPRGVRRKGTATSRKRKLAKTVKAALLQERDILTMGSRDEVVEYMDDSCGQSTPCPEEQADLPDSEIPAGSSEIGSAWQVGERVSIKGTATEWVANHKEIVIEDDLLKENRFATGKYHIEHGVRSIVYLPLIVKDKVIGGLIVASRSPNAYRRRQVNLLERLASQIAVSVENSRL